MRPARCVRRRGRASSTGQYPARIGITSPACHLPQVQLEKRLGQRQSEHEGAQRRQPHAAEAGVLHARRGAARGGLRDGAFRQVAPRPQPAAEPGDRYEPKDQGFDFDFPHTPSAAGPGGGYLAPWKFIKDPAITRPARRAHRGPHVGGGGEVHPRAQGPAVLRELLGLLGAFAVERAPRLHRALQAEGRREEPAAQPALRRDGARASTTAWAACSPRWTRRASPTARSSCSSPTTAAGPTRRRRPTPKASRTCRPRAICRCERQGLALRRVQQYGTGVKHQKKKTKNENPEYHRP